MEPPMVAQGSPPATRTGEEEDESNGSEGLILEMSKLHPFDPFRTIQRYMEDLQNMEMVMQRVGDISSQLKIGHSSLAAREVKRIQGFV